MFARRGWRLDLVLGVPTAAGARAADAGRVAALLVDDPDTEQRANTVQGVGSRKGETWVEADGLS